MPRYTLEFTGTAAANNAVVADFWCPTRRAALRELAVFNASGVNTLLGLRLVRASARGTQTTTVTPTAVSNAYDLNDAAPTLLVDTVFTVQPTLAALNMRGIEIPAVVENGIIWSWIDERLGVPIIGINAGIALVNQSGGAYGTGPTVYIDWEE